MIMPVINGNDVDSTDHGEEATGHPDDETHVDAARALKNSRWGDEDSAPDDAAHDHLRHRGCHDNVEAEDGNVDGRDENLNVVKVIYDIYIMMQCLFVCHEK